MGKCGSKWVDLILTAPGEGLMKRDLNGKEGDAEEVGEDETYRLGNCQVYTLYKTETGKSAKWNDPPSCPSRTQHTLGPGCISCTSSARDRPSSRRGRRGLEIPGPSRRQVRTCHQDRPPPTLRVLLGWPFPLGRYHPYAGLGRALS